MRNTFTISETEFPDIIESLLELSKTTPHFQYLDSHENPDLYQSHKWICAIGAKHVFSPKTDTPLDELFAFHQEHQDWLFGHLSYDLKNDLEELKSENPDHLAFPKLQFFIPETLIYSEGDTYIVKSHTYQNAEQFVAILPTENPSTSSSQVELKPKTSREQYLNCVNQLKEELQYGNIYEINYCIEFAQKAQIEPLQVFTKLSKLSKAPFMCYYRSNDQFMACASPERYLKKQGAKLISQPIKGTAKRSKDPVVDQELKKHLSQDEKERSENVMIVDLVRNDLSKVAQKASVKVDELFGIYSYPGVHQMISTVSCALKENLNFSDALKASFPMGSMTGAPKFKAMQLIEDYENFSRSLYSGSVGYITPSGDFDFNVVIRSILYSGKNQYVSARVGSAITIHCDAEKEYTECLLKAENLFRSLQSSPLQSKP
jgi:para-aminobenzoate synthetase component 1